MKDNELKEEIKVDEKVNTPIKDILKSPTKESPIKSPIKSIKSPGKEKAKIESSEDDVDVDDDGDNEGDSSGFDEDDEYESEEPYNRYRFRKRKRRDYANSWSPDFTDEDEVRHKKYRKVSRTGPGRPRKSSNNKYNTGNYNLRTRSKIKRRTRNEPDYEIPDTRYGLRPRRSGQAIKIAKSTHSDEEKKEIWRMKIQMNN